MLITVLIACGLIVVDQITKYLATQYLAPVGTLPFIPHIMELQYHLNDGAAFSFLSGVPGNQLILIGFTSIVLICLLAFLLFKKPSDPIEYFGWLLIFSGGIGNLIDRVLNGVVVDFFATTFIDFAIFNVADCYVCVGAGVLILALVLQEVRAKKQKQSTKDDAEQGDAV